METPVANTKVLTGVTTGTSPAVNFGYMTRQICLSIKCSAGVSAGAVTFESSDDPDYTGTWSIIGSAVTVPAASTILDSRVAGCFGYVRARVSTTVVGGTIDVRISGN